MACSAFGCTIFHYYCNSTQPMLITSGCSVHLLVNVSSQRRNVIAPIWTKCFSCIVYGSSKHYPDLMSLESFDQDISRRSESHPVVCCSTPGLPINYGLRQHIHRRTRVVWGYGNMLLLLTAYKAFDSRKLIAQCNRPELSVRGSGTPVLRGIPGRSDTPVKCENPLKIQTTFRISL